MRAILNGAWRFALVSLFTFGLWPLVPPLLPTEYMGFNAFVGTVFFFFLFTQFFLVDLVGAPVARKKFNLSFFPAFITYAIVWSAVAAALSFGPGKWIGSVLGCAAFALVLGKRLGAREGFGKAILFLMVAHSAGYFLGSKIYFISRYPPDLFRSFSGAQMMLCGVFIWSICYGLGFGAGIGYAFDVFQKTARPNGE